MPKTRHVFLHDRGPALWPEHRSEAAALRTRQVTPTHIWETTFQLNPTSSGGSAYKREWWANGNNRYIYTPGYFDEHTVTRFISWDTAIAKNETSAWSACIVGDLLDTYDVAIRDVRRKHVGMDELPDFLKAVASDHVADGKLWDIIVEAKGSGISLIQTLEASSDQWVANLLRRYTPLDSKAERYRLGAVWAKLGYIKFPFPGPEVPWLFTFTSEFWDAPNSRFLDQTDAATQLILYLEPWFEVANDARAAAAARLARIQGRI